MLATTPTDLLLDSDGLLSGLQTQSELTELLEKLYYEALS